MRQRLNISKIKRVFENGMVRFRRKEIGVVTAYVINMLTYMYCLSVATFYSENHADNLRYYALAAVTVYGFVRMACQGKLFRKKKRINMGLALVLAMGFYLWIASVWKARSVGYSVAFRTYVQIALMILPMIYAYSLVNLLSVKTITKLMEFTLLCAVIFYFYETFTKKGGWIFFDIGSWTSISFFHSYSVFENSTYPEVFLFLFLFFNYYKNMNASKKEKLLLRVCRIASFAFVFLTFKRWTLLFAVLFLVFGRFIDFNGHVSRRMVLATVFAIMAFTVLYSKFIQGELSIGNIDVYRFSMGRDYILSLWENHNYFSYGLGTSLLVIGRYLEMDLVQLYLEMGIVAVFFLALAFFRVSGTNIYTYILMLYEFLELLVASTFPTSFNWILLFVTVGCIATDKMEAERITVKTNSQGFLFHEKREKAQKENTLFGSRIIIFRN